MRRLVNVLLAGTALLLLLPFMVAIALLVAATSPGGAFFRQERIGRHGKPFRLLKFRSMRPDSESRGQLTIGGRDPRITRIGYFLRSSKLDELPQLWNILRGDMNVVGPRPEVPKYVALYTADQRRVLDVRPGLSDYASLEYFRENELLAKSDDPERTYINEVMPAKLKLNMKYIEAASVRTDLRVIARTLGRIIRG